MEKGGGEPDSGTGRKVNLKPVKPPSKRKIWTKLKSGLFGLKVISTKSETATTSPPTALGRGGRGGKGSATFWAKYKLQKSDNLGSVLTQNEMFAPKPKGQIRREITEI